MDKSLFIVPEKLISSLKKWHIPTHMNPDEPQNYYYEWKNQTPPQRTLKEYKLYDFFYTTF